MSSFDINENKIDPVSV